MLRASEIREGVKVEKIFCKIKAKAAAQTVVDHLTTWAKAQLSLFAPKPVRCSVPLTKSTGRDGSKANTKPDDVLNKYIAPRG